MASLSWRLKYEQLGRVSPNPSSCISLNYFSRERGRKEEIGALELRGYKASGKLLIVSSVFEDRGSSGDVCRAWKDKCQTFLFVLFYFLLCFHFPAGLLSSLPAVTSPHLLLGSGPNSGSYAITCPLKNVLINFQKAKHSVRSNISNSTKGK